MKYAFGSLLVLLYASVAMAGITLPIDKTLWQLPRWATNVTVVREEGKPVFKFVTSRRDGAQQIRRPILYPVDVARVVFEGRMKTESVAGGVAPIEKSRAQLNFCDVNGEHIGDWPKTIDRDGTTDWADFRQELTCPPNTRVVEVMLGMFYCTGTAWFGDVRLQAFDVSGKEIEATPTPMSVRTDTTGWVPLSTEAEDVSRPLVVDFAPYMPAPAGKFGFVTVKDGHFAFENGQRVRFWGTGDVTNWCPPKERAPAMAEGWARGGINLIRLHGMDAYDAKNTIFDVTSSKTDRLDPAKLDRLDFLLAECKKRGVYVNLNLLTKRKYTKDDGVRDFERLPQGGKAASMFDPRLIELQKDYDRLILEHVNPYTGLAYKDDPAIAMLEIVNESSVLDLNFSGGLPASYEDDLNKLFRAWCGERGIELPTEHYRVLVKAKDGRVAQFAENIEKKYFDDQYAFLKNELKVRIPICGTSTDGTMGERRAQFGLDMFDRHAYWDHPSGGWDPFSIFMNKPMVKIVSKWNVFDYLLGQRVMGKPFIVSEWNFAWPNDYVTEGPLLVGAYAGFNDWDSAMIFGTAGMKWADAMSDTFNHESKPHVMMPLMAMAMSFYRGDVTSGPITAVNAFDYPAGTSLVRQAFSREELLTRQCVLTDSDEKATKPAVKASADIPTHFRTADGQIDWTMAGKFVLDTPRTQAVLGFTEGQLIETKDLAVTMRNPFAQVIVTSLSSDPINAAPRLLITATARAENTDQEFRVFRKGIAKIGKGPILMEPVRATLEIRRQPTTAEPAVYVVDRFGRRTDRTIPMVQKRDGMWSIDLGDQSAGWLEVSFEPAKAQ